MFTPKTPLSHLLLYDKCSTDSYCFLLLGLRVLHEFLYLSSVLGMHLFGGKFCLRVDGDRCTCDDFNNRVPGCFRCERKNFDTLVWSLVTVFQVNGQGKRSR